ncbi:MAG: orotidine 5'-phosphate decarboxylase, partial [Candidatus Jacksonbacteria bacterium]|nr:orotidine 5'-phosphate decarboxylase [Candidatus Jacksonbacteria bacterium]
SPEDAIEQGGDIIIVGRGIYNDKDPKRAAIEYKERAWNALVLRDGDTIYS